MLPCEIGITCNNTPGSWDCQCHNGFKAISANDTFKVCQGKYVFKTYKTYIEKNIKLKVLL